MTVHNAKYNSAGSSSVGEVGSVEVLENAHEIPPAGEPNLDIDHTDHGNPKQHPIVPREHDIFIVDGHLRREKVGRGIDQ